MDTSDHDPGSGGSEVASEVRIASWSRMWRHAMDLATWDPVMIDQVVALLAPAWAIGTQHRIRPRLLAGDALNAVTEVVNDDEGRPVGVVHVSDDPTFAGNVGVAVAVAPAHRGEGIGRMLGGRALEILRPREGTRKPLVVVPEEPHDGRRFAERFGFSVVSRSVGWEAPLSVESGVAHRSALAELSSEKRVHVAVVTMESHGDQVDAVSQAATAGLPRAGGDEDEIDASTAWTYFFSPESTILLATIDDQPVGVSVVAPPARSNAWYIEFTGVDPAARGRGVARALKHAQFMVATDAGGTRLLTYNEEHNSPILALNEAFGMTRRPGYVGMTRAVPRTVPPTQ
jgi:GNAT superfamily N-acetyltransferase